MRKTSSVKVNKTGAKFIVAILLVLAVLGILLYSDRQIEKNAPAAERYVAEETVIRDYSGKAHKVRDDIETILVIGVDKHETEMSPESYLNNQQCDFLAVPVFDNTNKSYKVLIIDRDTMCEVTRLGISGKEAGSNIVQIAMAHTYGSGKQDSCRNVLKSIKKLLYGAPISEYVSFNLDAVGIVNDAVGGVTVTVPIDMTAINPEFVEGRTITLHGDEAEQFVRARRDLGEDNNENRIKRHEVYLEAIREQMAENKETDHAISTETLAEINDYVVANVSVERLQYYADLFETYSFEGFVKPNGEFVIEQYNEFFPNEKNLSDIVVSLFCK